MSRSRRWFWAACAAFLCLPVLAWAQSPRARQRAEDWTALVRSISGTQKLHARRAPDRVGAARQVRRRLEVYADAHLDLKSSESRYRGVFLWLRGMTYYWEGRPDRARIDFEDCLRKAERQDCLGKPCSVECEGGLRLLRARPNEPGFRISQEFKSGHTELSLEPQSFERTLDQSREVASRLVPRGGFGEGRAAIDSALGHHAAKADVAFSDELAVYRLDFPDHRGKPAKEIHARLLGLDGYLGKLLGVASLSSRDNVLVVYVVTSSGWEQEYREVPARLHHFEVSGTSYFEPLDNSATIVSTLPDPDGTIRHEFVHAVLDADFPGAPKWIDEGIAALHEAGRFDLKEDGSLRVTPYGNWRINLLVDGRKRLHTDLPSLFTLVDPDCQDWGPDYYLVAGAYSRYFVWYLHSKGVLADVYGRLRNGEDSREVLADVSRQLSASDGEASTEEAVKGLEADFLVFLKKRARYGGSVERRFYANVRGASPTCSPPVADTIAPDEGDAPGAPLEEPQPEAEGPSEPSEAPPPAMAPPPRRGCQISTGSPSGSWLILCVLLSWSRRRDGRR